MFFVVAAHSLFDASANGSFDERMADKVFDGEMSALRIQIKAFLY